MHACLDDSCDASGQPDYQAWFKRLKFGGSWDVGRYCGSMGDWPLLEHHQRRGGQKLAQAGIPVVVALGPEYPIGCRACSACCRSRSRRFDDDSALLSEVPSPAARGIILGRSYRCARLTWQ